MNDHEDTKVAARLNAIRGASAAILITLGATILYDQIRAVPPWISITAAAILIAIWIRPRIIQEGAKATTTAAGALVWLVVQTVQNATFWLLLVTGCMFAFITTSDILIWK